jgi:alpha-tubulin suppressor-like RCC1 family protein
VTGDNYNGDLGDSNDFTADQFQQTISSGVTAIAAGSEHSAFIQSGALFTMGDNTYGQLGSGNANPTNKPEQIVASGVTAVSARGNFTLFIKSDTSLWGLVITHIFFGLLEVN